MAIDSFTSTATGQSTAVAMLTVGHIRSLVSTATGVSAATAAHPFKLNVLGEIVNVPVYTPTP